MFAKIPEDKLTMYALDYNRQPDKARAFEEALGYTLSNSDELIKAIEEAFDERLLVYKGQNGYGDKFELLIDMTGPNGKNATVCTACTAWIRLFGDTEYSMTSIYVKKRKGVS